MSGADQSTAYVVARDYNKPLTVEACAVEKVTAKQVKLKQVSWSFGFRVCLSPSEVDFTRDDAIRRYVRRQSAIRDQAYAEAKDAQANIDEAVRLEGDE